MQYDDFIIRFEGLKLGNHQFKFLIDDAFFQNLEYSEISKGHVVVEAEMEKTERFMQFNMVFEGEVTVMCDRCGEDYEEQISFEEKLIVRSGDEADEDDGIMIIDRNAFQFDISHYLFESINLALPYKKTHPEVKGVPTCDPEILKLIAGSVDDIEEDDDEDDDNDSTNSDPRWDALKNLNK